VTDTIPTAETPETGAASPAGTLEHLDPATPPPRRQLLGRPQSACAHCAKDYAVEMRPPAVGPFGVEIAHRGLPAVRKGRAMRTSPPRVPTFSVVCTARLGRPVKS